MKGLAELIISFFDLLEAEGQLLRHNALRTLRTAMLLGLGLLFGAASGDPTFFNEDELVWYEKAVLFGRSSDYSKLGVRGKFCLVIGTDTDVCGTYL